MTITEDTTSAESLLKFARDTLGMKLNDQQVKLARAIIEGGNQQVQLSRPYGRSQARLVAIAYLAQQGPEATGEKSNLLLDNYVYGVDWANGPDSTAYTVARVPGRLRKWLRRTGLDRSKWTFKIIKMGVKVNETGKN